MIGGQGDSDFLVGNDRKIDQEPENTGAEKIPETD
jgi:hypothetical protein